MMMDMRKYPTCEVHHEIHAIGIFAAAAGDVAVVRAYIEGFNYDCRRRGCAVNGGLNAAPRRAPLCSSEIHERAFSAGPKCPLFGGKANITFCCANVCF